MDFSRVSINMQNNIFTNPEIKNPLFDKRATEIFAMRMTPEDKRKVWRIAEHFDLSMSRVVHEALAQFFPLADEKMKVKRPPNTIL
jgi:hypothetical protein